MTFITFVTRTMPRRAEMLEHNQESLMAQTVQDYVQHIIIDDAERGVEWANGLMAARDWSVINSDYVMVLDDDDVLNDTDIIELLQNAIKQYRVDLLGVRMDHGPLGVLPPDDLWPGEPVRGRVGCSAVVPCRALFVEAVKAYKPQHDGDFDYVDACYSLAESVTWLDLVASKVTQIGAYSLV